VAFTLQVLQNYCDRTKLRLYGASQEVYLFDRVDPYRSEGITRQFLEDARVYHERYFKPTHFSALLQRAFEQAAFPIDGQPGLAVLDLGSGSGNTVIPLLSRNRSLKLVATDLSIDLLQILATLVRDKEYANQIGFICADANQKTFYDGVFDVVVGASILHHLIDPAKVLTNALAYLKPGGLAVFFEPFEYGCNLMKNLYLLVLDEPRCQADLPPEVVAHFKAIIRDYNARFDLETVKPFTKDLDDKWLFTKRFFADICRRSGCRLVEILNNKEEGLAQAYTNQLLENLKLSGLGHYPLPSWLLQLCGEFDQCLDLSLKRGLVLDGTAVIRKAPSA
jgi:SAM-dependent methyltransferase